MNYIGIMSVLSSYQSPHTGHKQGKHPVLKVFFESWKTYPLCHPKHTIGRSHECSIQIRCSQVSRQQAVLYCGEAGQIQLVDGDGQKPSRNGTYVNGSRIKKCWLKVGDVIQLGSSLAIAKLELAPEEEEKNRLEAELRAFDEFFAEPSEESPTAISTANSSSPQEGETNDQDSVEQLTSKINQLNYELGIREQKLKQQDDSYGGLQDTFEKYKYQVEQEKSKTAEQIEHLTRELANARHHLKKYEQHYDTLVQELELRGQRIEQRCQAEQSQAQDNLILDILTVVDNFELAQRHMDPTAQDSVAIHQGYQSIYRLLLSLLKRSGVTRIHTLNAEFDPVLHEAIACTPTTQVPENHILQENQAGYEFRDRVIRPAKVTVARSCSTGSSPSRGLDPSS